MKVVDERTGTLYDNTDYQWRLEATTTGQTQTYLINVMQARDVTGADLQISMTEDSSSFTITLKDPVSGKTAVVKLAKGMTSTGGSLGFSTTGTPATLSPFASGIETIQVTTSGVVWGGGTTPTPPAGAASLQVTAAASATAGSPTTVTVRALDLAGSVYAGYTGTVRFSSSDVQAGLPASYTFTAADAGTHTFNVTLKTAATQTVQVTDAANLTGSASIAVNPAAASNVSVTGFPSPTTAGTTQSFTVSLRDAYGNMATGYTGTLRFSSSDLQAALPTNYSFTTADRGKKSFQGALKTAGTQSVTATDMTLTQLNGSQGGIVVNPPGDTTPPNVTAMTPTGGTTGVGLGTNVTATFSEGVQAATISFTLKDAANNVVPAVISYDSTTKTVTLTPSIGLAANTTYTATLSGAKDLAGNVMSGSVTWSFTTTGSTTVAPPSVTGYTPANGSTGVDPWTALTATFSTQVQGRTVSFTLKDATGTPVLATMWYDGSTQTAKLVPSAALVSNTTYTAAVSGAMDLSGNVMTDPVSWTFTTAAYTDWKQATATDFASGTFSGTMPTSPAAGIQLQSNFTENFTGTSLNTSNWTRTNWGSGAAATVSNGVVSVAASAITSTQSVGANGVSGYVRFRAASYQHFGLATSVASESGTYWAMFSTFGTSNTLYARVNINGVTKNVSLGALPTGFHVYTVQPTTGGYQFYVDGALKTTISATMPTGVALKAILSAYTTTTISANWIQFVSFVPSGSYVSMVYDATRTANWGAASWAGDLPAGTTVTVQTRSGNSATPDSTWSDWSTVSNGGKVASPAGRYLQYQVLFTTTNPLLTPTLTMMDLTWI